MAPTDQTGTGLTRNAFLGGQLRIWQPERGYRAGIDPVLLAASVPARPGESVLELGCGAGVAALCLGRRVPGLHLTGLELQPFYAGLARRNAAENALRMEVVEGDLAAMPETLRARRFDHVIVNPPWFERDRGTQASDPGREAALGEVTPLALWVEQAARRCAPGGHVCVIQHAERLPELLAHARLHLGSIEVLPLLPRARRAASRVLMRARKGGRAGFRLHDGWVLHEGSSHAGDRDSFTEATEAVLRLGAPLPFPG